MNNFTERYLDLLRQQVDDEIGFLIRNGHDNEKIYVPCKFCIDTGKGYSRCFRLKNLREFQSQIVQAQSKKDDELKNQIDLNSDLPLSSDLSKEPLIKIKFK